MTTIDPKHTNGVAGPAIHAPLPEREARPPHYVAPPAPPLPPSKPKPQPIAASRARKRKPKPTKRFLIRVGEREFLIYASSESAALNAYAAQADLTISEAKRETTLRELQGDVSVHPDNIIHSKQLRESRERQEKAGVLLCGAQDAADSFVCDVPALPGSSPPRCAGHRKGAQ